MAQAICFKCGARKSEPLDGCPSCYAYPASDHDRAVSLALSDRLSSAVQLDAFSRDVPRYGYPIIDPKLMERARMMLPHGGTSGAQAPGASRSMAEVPFVSTVKTEASGANALELNPFNVLGATTRDAARRIIELAEERALSTDSRLCAKARADLVTPRTRLTAEVAWLPGLSPQRAKTLLGGLHNEIDALREKSTSIPHLAHANLLAAAFELLSPDMDVNGWCEWIRIFANTVEDIDPEQVMRDINEDRSVSGFPEVKAQEAVATELGERRRHYTACIKKALNDLPSDKLLNVLTAVISTATNNGKEHAPLLIDEVIDTYQTEAEVHLQTGAERIKKLIDGARAAAPRGPEAVKPFTNRLDGSLRAWSKLAKPIQVSMKARGLDHDLSRSLAFEVRSLCIDLFNEHDMVELVADLTNKLRDLFGDLPEVKQRLQDDSKAIQEIVQGRAEQRKKDDEWAREITYEADIGAIFKDRLRISPDGLEWKSRVYPLDKITRVRWGGVSHSVNGIPSGSTYTIAFGDGNSEEFIELKRSEVYENAVSKIWAAVGPRLMFEMLQKLKAGKRLRFGDGIVDDKGVQLTKHKFLGSEQLYVAWSDTHIWSHNGSFFIGAKTDKKTYASMSYIDTPNAHICEAVIRAAFKKGAIPLSRLLVNE